ncbi:hypothetical protein PVK06_043134 [Gossypium arboreum]|uniref:Reverse transcriptase n=1 Tax=Gossypium arboreum TaxID=29729 RepID=A0ABR0MMN7_GOSAR|nr:hypothetical protein PVK06_043134 [Gossypium arboreum]
MVGSAFVRIWVRIFAKVLANRLKQIQLGIISPSQYVFVSGRLVTDNTLVAYEVIHHMKKNVLGNVGEAIYLELDFKVLHSEAIFKPQLLT